MKRILSVILMTVMLMSAFSAVPAAAEDSYVMTVVADGITTYYDNFGEGWAFAVETSEETPTVVTLYRDWYAGDTNSNGVIDSDETPGYFKYYNKDGDEVGTKKGALSVGDTDWAQTRYIDLTLDLNGHTISRNLESPVENGSVFFVDARNLYIKDSSEAKTGKITGGNTTSSGGGLYVEGVSKVFVENCEISGNYAQELGGGIYITGDENGVSLDSVKITGNKAGLAGGGFCIDEGWGNVFDIEEIYLGGDILIWGNERFDGTQDNLYFHYNIEATFPHDIDLLIKQCMGQSKDVPYSPLTKNARIGVSANYDNVEMTREGSRFDLESYKYFIPDDPENYYIRTVYDGADKTNLHQLHYTMKGNGEVTTPNIRTVSVKDTNLLKRASIDYENQVITLTAYNNKKNHFNYVSLSGLITYTTSEDVDVVVGRNDICNLLSPRKYRVMGTDQTYTLCTVQVVPDGGEWAEVQEEVENDYVMTIDDGERFCAYSDFETGWTEAIPLSQKRPTTVKLLSDWIAPDKDGDGNGDFYYENSRGSEYGTDEGRLHLATDTIEITIDLNGHTLSRNLSSPKEHGQVFRIEAGSLTITDSSEAQTGKLTGGNNTGNGGAFYVDYGKLYINGGEISGNKATNGAGIYATNASDTYVYIKGGKVCNNSADINGGGIYMYNGYLYVDGGEISDNKAVDGGGVYWSSRDAGCFTGGKITGNKASGEGGGVYGADWGEIYLGGTAVIVDNKQAGNIESNLYLCENDVDINHTRGQATGVPNKPLTDGANIGITSVDTYDLISGGDSCFDQGSFGYLHADDDHKYFIRSVYDADEDNNSHQLWYTAWSDSNARYPRVKTVGIENGNVLNDVKFDYKHQVITLVVSKDVAASLKSVRLDSLINYTCDHEGEYILDADQPRDLRTPQEYKIMSDNGTYVTCLVKVDWFCAQHKDSDGDCICDDCDEYTLTDFTIVNYNEETNEATVFAPKSGKYVLVFADCEGDRLENVDMVEYEFTKGINTVSQENKTFALENGDKVMLWYDMAGIAPVCDALTVN